MTSSLLSTVFPVVTLLLAVEPRLSYSVRRSVLLETSFRQCCTAHGVPEDCARQLCTYSTKAVSKDAVCQYAEKCAIYTGEWLHCAMDGNEVSDCIEKYRHKEFPLSQFCLDNFANGTSPSVEYVFSNGLESNKCLKRLQLFNYCWKKSINGTSHQNVCLEPGPDCRKFSHQLTENASSLFELYVFLLTRSCDEVAAAVNRRKKRSVYRFEFY